MKRLNLKLYCVALALFAFGMVGCQDLDVENQNNPNRERVLANPGDVEGLIGGLFIDAWFGMQECDTVWPTSAMADEFSASWGNAGMRDLSAMPRVAIDNTTTYNYAGIFSDPWGNEYTTISNAADALGAIAASEAEFKAAGVDIVRARAFSKMMQGMAHGFLGALYDQAFVFDETIDLTTTTPELVPYDQVIAASIKYYEEAIALASGANFVIPASWIMDAGSQEGSMPAAEMVRLANSLAARTMAWGARSAAERAAVDWNKVKNFINNGLNDDEVFAPIGDEDSGLGEWDCQKYYAQEGHTEIWGDSWHRADNYTVGPADESGAFEAWLSTPASNRNVFLVDTDDKRVTGHTVPLYDADGNYTGGSPTFPDGTTIANASADMRATTDGKYFIFDRMRFDANGAAYGQKCAPGPFPGSRGTYHYSCYSHVRFQSYLLNGANGVMLNMDDNEMDLLKAEALLWTNGSAAEIAALINKSRVGMGEMEPVTAGTAKGSVQDLPNPNLGDGATLWSALMHEFGMETMGTQGALAYFTDRGWDKLVKNTPIHYPVPAGDLEQLQLSLYTFGGGGDGSAPGTSNSGWKTSTKEDRLKKKAF